jgi:hypothetical protein
MCGRPVGITSVVLPIPNMSPMGVSNAASLAKPTTSAFISNASPGVRSTHSSPTFTVGTTALMMVPMTWMTRPLMRSVTASSRARASRSGRAGSAA